MNLNQAFFVLHSYYGTYKALAQAVGYSANHLAAVRKRGEPISNRGKKIIISKAESLVSRSETFKEILLRENPGGVPSTLKPTELCKILKISPMSLYQRIQRKKMLPPQRESNKRLFWDTDTLIDFFNSQNYRRPVYVEKHKQDASKQDI